MGVISSKLADVVKPFVTDTIEAIFGKGKKLNKLEKGQVSRQANKFLKKNPQYNREDYITAAKALVKSKKTKKPVTTKQKNWKPDPNYKAPKPKDIGSTKGLTPKQKRERAKLVKKVEEEMARANLPPSGADRSRRRKTGPKGTPQEQKVQQGPLLSKVPPPEKVSKARRRQLVETGQAKMRKGKGGKSVIKTTGEFAPPAHMIAEEMGLKGQGKLPTAKEAEELGLTIKKYGGKVKRNMGGPVRGVGAATKGFGNAKYSSKLY